MHILRITLPCHSIAARGGLLFELMEALQQQGFAYVVEETAKLFTFAASRTASRRDVVFLRLSVRIRSNCWLFPSVTGLPSVNSATLLHVLFTDFSGTMPVSDLLNPVAPHLYALV